MIQISDLYLGMSEKVVFPILLELEKETSQPIQAKTSLLFSGEVMTRDIATRAGETNGLANGEVRIVVKDSVSVDSFRFSAEAIFRGLAPGTGFSGFSITGKLTFGAEVVPTLTGRVNRYNVWSWRKDFIF